MVNSAGDVAKFQAQAAGQSKNVESAGRVGRAAIEPPPAEGWRYRRSGPPRWAAVFGIGAGLLAFVVPGLFAIRSYRRWQEGTRALPSVAWALAGLGAWSMVALGISFLGFPIVAALLSLVAMPVICLAAWRN